LGLRELFEDALKIKIRPKNNQYAGVSITSDKEDLANQQIHSTENSSLIDLDAVNKFRTLSADRQERYTEFEGLLKDATIAAAIEMYADDSTQYDYRTGKVIWAESDDNDIEKAANRLINVLNLNEKAWTHIYALCTYGDVYLRLYRDGDESDYNEILDTSKTNQTLIRVKPEDESRPIEEYIEYVDDPATMYDLQIKDNTAGFIRMINTDAPSSSSYYSLYMHKTIDAGDVNVYDRKSFVHICLDGNIDRHPELVTLTNSKTGTTTVYKVKTGKSILADAYEASQTVKLLEDSMMLSRVTKSALIRILQIETGNIPKPEVEALLHRVKSLIEQGIAINKQNGTVSSYNSPGPMENIIYVPTKEGKGAITIETLGGDVNIRDIADIDYFNNKKLSALKIPKQYLNYDAPEGLGNGTSLTKLSSRYAHTIMRIQNAYISGITRLLNIYFLDKDLDYINKFTIKMVSPATIEDAERDEQLDTRLNQASSIIDMINGKTTEVGMLEVVKWIINEFLKLSDIADILNKYPATEDTNNGFDAPSDNDMNFDVNVNNDFGSPSGSSYDSFNDYDSFDTNSDFESPSETSSDVGGEESVAPEF
jgi:hypothetical protein